MIRVAARCGRVRAARCRRARRWLPMLAASFASLCPAGEAPPRRPNVLFIAVDDLNHWVGYLGRNPQTKTPHIDRLAARGVWFTRSYCAAPLCSPSRAALMSGLRPGATGAYLNGSDWRSAIPEGITLPSAFRKAGYYVSGAGKIYHSSVFRDGEWEACLRGGGGGPPPAGPREMAGAFDITPLGGDDADMPDYRVVTYGIEELRKSHARPFFLAIGIVKPHLPWRVPRKYYDMHPLDSIALPPYREDDLADLPPAALRIAKEYGDHARILESGTWKKAVRAYLATITFCDAMVGRLLAALDASPYRDNTIICFWSDHGWHLGEKHHWRKFALWEEATRAPFIMVVPGLTAPDRRCDRTVDFMSIYPTLTDLCGIPTPAHVQGKSIRALLADPTAAWSDPAVCTFGFKNHAVRTEAWRYIRYANGNEELYDERADPFEWVNLAAKPDTAARKTELARHLPAENKPEAGGRAKTAPAKKAKAKGTAGARAEK